MLRPQGPGSPQSVYTWGRESVGGSPSCEAHVLPARARLRVMEEQDQTVETESTDRPQAAPAMPGQPADPPTQTLGPWLWLQEEKGAFFRGDISSCSFMFPACSAQRAESPEPVSPERQAPAPEQTAHPWPWALEQPHGQDSLSHSLLSLRTQPCLPGQLPEERSPRSQTRPGVFAHTVPFITYSAL